MATTYTDATAGRVVAWPLQGRTDADGVEQTDGHFDGRDAGILLAAFSDGVLASDHYQVRETVVPAMSVRVGSGTVGDKAILHGGNSFQPVYGVSWPDGTTALSVPAANLSNPRIDEVYLVVQDDQYDTSGRVLPRLAYRDGTPAGSPSPPGPDGNWTAYLLLASVHVDAGAVEVTQDDIVDERVYSRDLLAHPPGEISMYGGSVAPPGALLCQGQTVSRSTFRRLFAAIGTVYGPGDGSTTFGLPDLRRRFPLGKAASGTGSTLGETGGSIDHNHSVPSHSHGNPSTGLAGGHSHDNPSTGSAGSHGHGDTFAVGGETSGDGLGPSPNQAGQGHRHALSGGVSSAGSHSHPVGNTGSVPSHSHPQAATSVGGGDPTGSANPPFQVVNYIIWT